MPAKQSASIMDKLTSLKGAAVLVPAILLVGATLAIGQTSTPSDTTAPAAVTEPAAAQSAAPATSAFTPAQRKELEGIIKDILLNNPEIMLEVQNALESKMDKIQAERMAVAIKEHATELYRPTGSPVVGNAKGDVPVIEFFDYNCGYCKKALSELSQLMDKDKKVRVILKEFPILAKGSEEASRVALAAKMQGKYWEFHRAMLESPGPGQRGLGAAHRREARPRHAPPQEGHGLRRGEEGDRGHAPARHQDGHPGHAALHRRRSHHRRRPGEPDRAARQARGRRAQGRLQGVLTAVRLTRAQNREIARNASAQLAVPPFRACGNADRRGG